MKKKDSPFWVLIQMSIGLDRSFIDQKLHPVVERGSDRRGRFSKQNIQWIRWCQTHERIFTLCPGTAFTVRTIYQTICMSIHGREREMVVSKMVEKNRKGLREKKKKETEREKQSMKRKWDGEINQDNESMSGARRRWGREKDSKKEMWKRERWQSGFFQRRKWFTSKDISSILPKGRGIASRKKASEKERKRVREREGSTRGGNEIN